MSLADLLPAAPAASNAAPAARRTHLLTLLSTADTNAAHALWQQELASGDPAYRWAQSALERAMQQGDFNLIDQLGKLLAYRWRSPWHPERLPAGQALPRVPRDILTVSKLRHDAGQFAYLRQLGLLDATFDATIDTYRHLTDRMAATGQTQARKDMNDAERALIGNTDNRIVYLPEVDRVERALSPSWNPRDIEARFLEHGEGLVVIDDFLTPQALEGLHRFAMQATVWTGIRYAFGRFGAFFQDGFNCPLLLQVAEELQAALPRVITPRYPLRQIWGFKNADDLPADVNLHADFAAVNVTMLYGQRENDQLHRSLSSRPDLETRWGRHNSAWRSPAFGRHR